MTKLSTNLMCQSVKQNLAWTRTDWTRLNKYKEIHIVPPELYWALDFSLFLNISMQWNPFRQQREKTQLRCHSTTFRQVDLWASSTTCITPPRDSTIDVCQSLAQIKRQNPCDGIKSLGREWVLSWISDIHRDKLNENVKMKVSSSPSDTEMLEIYQLQWLFALMIIHKNKFIHVFCRVNITVWSRQNLTLSHLCFVWDCLLLTLSMWTQDR